MKTRDVLMSVVALLNVALFFFLLGVIAKIIWLAIMFGWDAVL